MFWRHTASPPCSRGHSSGFPASCNPTTSRRRGWCAAWRKFPNCKDAVLIGRIEAGKARVVLEIALGGRRLLDELENDPLPRIC